VEAPFTTPSALVLDPHIRWEPVDKYTARLIVPFREQEETLRAEFDPGTGLMKSMSGMRYRDQEETKAPWRGEFSEWRMVHGIKVPLRNMAIWEDQGEPYGIFEIEGVEYNVNVSDKVSESWPAQDMAYAGDRIEQRLANVRLQRSGSEGG